MRRTPFALAACLAIVAIVTAAASCSSSSSSTPADAGPADARRLVDARTTCDDAGTSCDPFLSCGCQATEKCAPGQSGLACLPNGAAQPGAPCTDDTSCVRGSTCVSYAGQTTCHAFCDDVHPCAAGTSCYIKAADRSGATVGTLCGPSCGLFTQDCPATFGCYPFGTAGSDTGICLTAGAGGQGASCADMSDCKGGYACIRPTSTAAAICAKICDRKGSGPSCDQASEGMCRAFLDSSANSQSGVCLP